MTELDTLESVIARGFKAYMQAGEAFLEIRTHKLWKGKYPTYTAYLRERWHISSSRARQLIAAYRVMSAMIDESVTIGNALEFIANERELRPLTKLPAHDALAVYRMAQGSLPEGKTLTESHVRRALNYYEELQATKSLEIMTTDGEFSQVSLDAVTPYLLKEAQEAQKRQAQGIKFDAAKQFEYLTQKAKPEELYALVKLLVRWLKENRKGVGV